MKSDADAIQSEMQKHGVTCRQVASRLNVDRRTFQKWRNGSRKPQAPMWKITDAIRKESGAYPILSFSDEKLLRELVHMTPEAARELLESRVDALGNNEILIKFVEWVNENEDLYMKYEAKPTVLFHVFCDECTPVKSR